MITAMEVTTRTSSQMLFAADDIVNLARIFDQNVDLFGNGPPKPPWGAAPSLEAFTSAVTEGAKMLPLVYQNEFSEKLLQALPRLTTASQRTPETYESVSTKILTEILMSAVWQHAPACDVTQQLTRFIAVVSGIYSSFLNTKQRTKIGLPKIEVIPPLVRFDVSGQAGPYTLTSEVVRQRIGSGIAVVSLPSTYRDHPLTWTPLAHETGGHDVTHADPGLLNELGTGVFNLFASVPGATTQQKQMGMLWQYWIDETSADVYGLLNSGPAFALSFTAWLMTLRKQSGNFSLPQIATRTVSSDENPLDTHPTDILRIYLAIGVISSLNSLDETSKAGYIQILEQVALVAAGSATNIEISGSIPSSDDPRKLEPVSLKGTLQSMGESAKAVGRYIATTPCNAWNGRNIQEIRTWDDVSEAQTRKLAASYIDGKRLPEHDPAIVLSAATIAVLKKPEIYDLVTKRVNFDLDRIFHNDAYWGLNGTPVPVLAKLMSQLQIAN